MATQSSQIGAYWSPISFSNLLKGLHGPRLNWESSKGWKRCSCFWVPIITFTHHIKWGHIENARANRLQIHIFGMPATNGRKVHDELAVIESKQDVALIEIASTIAAAINETYNPPGWALNAIDWNVEYIKCLLKQWTAEPVNFVKSPYNGLQDNILHECRFSVELQCCVHCGKLHLKTS